MEYRSEPEVSARLQRFEEKHDLLQHRFDGWCAWPVLRFSVGRALQNLPLDQGSRVFSRPQLALWTIHDLLRMPWLPKSQILAKTYSSYHVEREAGARKDVFFDDVLRAYQRGFKLEVLNRAARRREEPLLVPRNLTTVALQLLGAQLARRFPAPGIAAPAQAISEATVDGLGEVGLSASFVARRLTDFYWGKRLMKGLLRQVRPKVVLLADIADLPITAAARELGIGVVEFQHGICHRDFLGNSWTRYALAYKDSMALPHRVFLYGEHWRREMQANGFWGPELRVVGNSRVDWYRQVGSQRRDDVCTMVLTTQGADTERLIAFLAAFARLAESEGFEGYELFVKMHPSYPTNRRLFEEALGGWKSVRIVSGDESPGTFELLARSHLHLSIYSFCHYEALALGVPTAIVPLTGAENVMHLHEAGQAFCPRTPEELLGIVTRWREHDVPRSTRDEYFTPGALDNIRRELAQLGV